MGWGTIGEALPAIAADVNPLKVPDNLPDEKVLFLSDIMPTGWHAAEMGSVGKGDRSCPPATLLCMHAHVCVRVKPCSSISSPGAWSHPRKCLAACSHSPPIVLAKGEDEGHLPAVSWSGWHACHLTWMMPSRSKHPAELTHVA